jgi:hypothetical protein
MTIVAAGCLLGVAASLHCVAMCGPLMSAVLGGRRGRAPIVYHGARVTSYAALGLGAGTAGHLAILAGAGRVLSVSVGLALIWSAAVRIGWCRSSFGSSVESNGRLSRAVTSVIARAARAVRATGRESSWSGIAAAGVLNGLLPCGAVYAALAAAAALGDVRLSASFMVAFGAGTLPALAFAGEISARVARVAGARWRQAAPAALMILGVLLTARGLMPSHHHEPSMASSAPAHDHSPSAHTSHHTPGEAAGHR